MAKQTVLNKRTAQPNNPPRVGMLQPGEIAVSYCDGYEKLYIENTNKEVVGFVNDNEFQERENVIAASLTDLNTKFSNCQLKADAVGQKTPDAGEIFNNAKTANSNAHAEGNGTEASGRCSHAEGLGTQATTQSAHSEGEGTKALNVAAHSEGYHTEAQGDYSHSEGYNNIAKGLSSHAEGSYTNANGRATHTEGENTIATNWGEHAQGFYNISNTDTIDSVGIGFNDEVRKNAEETLKNGKKYILNVGDYNGTNPTSTNDVATVIGNKSDKVHNHLISDITNLNEASVNYANSAGSATNDSEGNAINTTYLHLSGGTVTGTTVFSTSIIGSEGAFTTLRSYGSREGEGFSATSEGVITAKKLVTRNGKESEVVCGDGSLKPLPVDTNTTYTLSGDGNATVTLTPSSGDASAVTVNNVANATSAKNDSDGNIIKDTYAKTGHTHNWEDITENGIATFSPEDGVVTFKDRFGEYATIHFGNENTGDYISGGTGLTVSGGQNATLRSDMYSELQVGLNANVKLTPTNFTYNGKEIATQEWVKANDKDTTYTLSRRDFSDKIRVKLEGSDGSGKSADIPLATANSVGLIDGSQFNKINKTVGESFGAGQGEIFNDYKNNKASGIHSHAEGYSSIAEGKYTHSEGYETHSQGDYSHSEGKGGIAAGFGSHVEGVAEFNKFDVNVQEVINETPSGYRYDGNKANKENMGKIVALGNHQDETIDLKPNSFFIQKGNNILFPGTNRYLWVEDVVFDPNTGKSTIYSRQPISDLGLKAQVYTKTVIVEGGIVDARGAHVEGGRSRAFGDFAHAEGYNCRAHNSGSHAEGVDSKALGEAGHAEGYDTKATGKNTHSEGNTTVAKAPYSHVEGMGGVTENKAYGGHVEGYYTIDSSKDEAITNLAGRSYTTNWPYHKKGEKLQIAQKIYTIVDIDETGKNITLDKGAEFFDAIKSTGRITVRVISGCKAYNHGSHAEGEATSSIGEAAHSEGCYTTAKGNFSHAEGLGFYNENQEFVYVDAVENAFDPVGSSTEGYMLKNTKIRQTLISDKYFIISKDPFSEESHNVFNAEEDPSRPEKIFITPELSPEYFKDGYIIYRYNPNFSITNNSIANGEASHSEGKICSAFGDFSHAEGFNTLASGKGAHSEGTGSVNYKTNFVLEQSYTLKLVKDVEGPKEHNHFVAELVPNALALPDGTEIFVEGKSYTINKSKITPTDGTPNTYRFDYYTTPYAPEKYKNIYVNNEAPVYVRQALETVIANEASGEGSHAEGIMTKALKKGSHSEGVGTIASAQACHVEGSYNVPLNNAAHIVGCGSSDTSRKNAHVIAANGNSYFLGVGGYDGITPFLPQCLSLGEALRAINVIDIENKTKVELTYSQLKSALNVIHISQSNYSRDVDLMLPPMNLTTDNFKMLAFVVIFKPININLTLRVFPGTGLDAGHLTYIGSNPGSKPSYEIFSGTQNQVILAYKDPVANYTTVNNWTCTRINV